MEKGGRLGWSKREGREGKGKTEKKKKGLEMNPVFLPSFLCFVCVYMSLVSLLSLGQV